MLTQDVLVIDMIFILIECDWNDDARDDLRAEERACARDRQFWPRALCASRLLIDFLDRRERQARARARQKIGSPIGRLRD